MPRASPTFIGTRGGIEMVTDYFADAEVFVSAFVSADTVADGFTEPAVSFAVLTVDLASEPTCDFSSFAVLIAEPVDCPALPISGLASIPASPAKPNEPFPVVDKPALFNVVPDWEEPPTVAFPLTDPETFFAVETVCCPAAFAAEVVAVLISATLLTELFTVPLAACDAALTELVTVVVLTAAFTAAWVVDCKPRFTCPKEQTVIPVANAIEITVFIVFIV
jgi:hypothetical protein